MEKQMKVTIKGISPLLMNRPNMLDIGEKVKQKQAGVDVLKHQFKDKQYLTSEGKLFTPDTHIKGALMESSKSMKVVGKGKSTYSKIVGYAVLIEPCQIIHQKQKVEEFVVLAVNPTTHGRNPLCRPMLKEWGLTFTLTFDSDEIPEEVIKDCLDVAGKRVGIGDWRPAKKGTFGRFIVTEFKEA